jgi:hypothetical protein
MNNIYTIIVIILVILNILSFILGFLLGKILSISGVSILNKPKSFMQSQPSNNTINIDEKIHITDIKTDGMIKKYENLGEIKNSNENITNSIDKLKRMKG